MSEQSGVPQPHGDPLRLRDMLWGLTVSQAESAVAKLGLVDVLGDRPKTSHEIGGTLAANELALLRLLRAPTSVDLLVEDEHGASPSRRPASSCGRIIRILCALRPSSWVRR